MYACKCVEINEEFSENVFCLLNIGYNEWNINTFHFESLKYSETLSHIKNLKSFLYINGIT